MREPLRTGLETYVAQLYKRGDLTLRDAAHRLNLDLVAIMDLMLDHGVKGNLEASDVLQSVEQFSRIRLPLVGELSVVRFPYSCEENAVRDVGWQVSTEGAWPHSQMLNDGSQHRHK